MSIIFDPLNMSTPVLSFTDNGFTIKNGSYSDELALSLIINDQNKLVVQIADDTDSHFEIQCIQNISENGTQWLGLEYIGTAFTTYTFVYDLNKVNHFNLMLYASNLPGSGKYYHWWDNISSWTHSEEEEEEEDMNEDVMIEDPEIERLLGEYVRQHVTDEDIDADFFIHENSTEFARIRRAIVDPKEREDIKNRLYEQLHIEPGTFADEKHSNLQVGLRLPTTEDSKA